MRFRRNGIDRLIAAGDLTEDEAENLDLVTEAIASLVNGGGIERLRELETTQASAEEPSSESESARPAKVKCKADKPLFTY